MLYFVVWKIENKFSSHRQHLIAKRFRQKSIVNSNRIQRENSFISENKLAIHQAPMKRYDSHWKSWARKPVPANVYKRPGEDLILIQGAPMFVRMTPYKGPRVIISTPEIRAQGCVCTRIKSPGHKCTFFLFWRENPCCFFSTLV